MLLQKPKLILIVGPTAVGKTTLCIDLAKKLNTDIISCDSRQFYKELSIGTAKPTAQEMQGVRHHLIDSHSIADYYSVGDFERDSLKILDKLFKEKEYVIMTGGSGLFVKAIIDGLDEMPEADLGIRQNLMERLENEGVDVLAEELKNLDPIYAAQVDLKNSQRVVRALEVCIATGKPFTDFRRNTKTERPFEIVKIALDRPREELYQRINQRVNLMLANGLIDEVKSVAQYRQQNALQTVGYKEVFDYLDGTISYEMMVELIKRNSRRYAKRQMTWFKNQDSFEWISVGGNIKNEEVINQILNLVKNQ